MHAKWIFAIGKKKKKKKKLNGNTSKIYVKLIIFGIILIFKKYGRKTIFFLHKTYGSLFYLKALLFETKWMAKRNTE